MNDSSTGDRHGRVQLRAITRRRQFAQGAPRDKKPTARMNAEEFTEVKRRADALNMSVGAYLVAAALVNDDLVAMTEVAGSRLELLPALMDMQRQLRGACANLNQAVARMHTFDIWPVELEPVAKRVREVATNIDALIAELAARR